jgi:hypothetical protein
MYAHEKQPDTAEVALNTSVRQEAALINRLHALPGSALLTPAETSVYLNARRDLLRAWRWRGCGPRYVGKGHLIRYRKSDLDSFLGAGDQPEAA